MPLFTLPTNLLAASQAVNSGGDISRRSFLAGLGGLAALTIAGCGTSESDPDSGHLGDGGHGPDTLPSSFPVESDYATLPSRFSAALNVGSDRVVGLATTCAEPQTGDRNHLFRFDPDAALPSLAQDEFNFEALAGRKLSNFVRRGTTNRAVVTANDGFYQLTLGSTAAPRFIEYPSGVTFGGGALYHGAKLYIAAANLDEASLAYGDGKLLVYNLDGSNWVIDTPPLQIPTSRRNPTGVALRGANELVVLNSGDFSSSSRASIDIINTASNTVARTIQLGALTAQVSSQIALTSDGRTAVIGTSDQSGRVLFVDLETGEVSSPLVLGGTTFHSSVKIDQNLVYVTDFGVDDRVQPENSRSSVTVLNLATRAVHHTINFLFGAAGLSEIYEGTLIQSVPYGAVRIVPA